VMRAFAVVVLLLAGPLVASARGGSLLASLVNTESVAGSAEWDNRTVSAEVRSRDCRVDVDVRNADAIAGENVVCVSGLDALNTDAFRGGVSTLLESRVSYTGRLRIRSGAFTRGDVTGQRRLLGSGPPPTRSPTSRVPGRG